uniref:hypothetical protein n=1 Tax=Aliarcobacter sp. TaxID=2321116 RepID=UPI0040479430
MLKKISFLFLMIFLFTSCSIQNEKKLKISTTTWIGYSPLYYAKEKGWLEPLNIKLLNVVSLSENMYLYKAGNSDAYVGTQYEYTILENENLIPIIMFDKSNGGDIVMSNQSINELQKEDSSINVYLEMDSINSIIFKDFIKQYNLTDKNFNYINKDQAFISTLKNSEIPTIIVTYVPYNTSLEKEGFKEITSTKNNENLIVVDAMFTSKELFRENEKRFVELKKIIDNSIEILKENPKDFFETIKAYLPYTTFEDFEKSLNDIIWINKNIPEKLIEKLNNSNFPTKEILK